MGESGINPALDDAEFEFNGRAKYGDHNIVFIKYYLLNEKFDVAADDLGSFQPRRLMFYLATGKAWVKKLHSKVQSFVKKDTEYQRNLANQNLSSSSEAEPF